MRRLLMWGLAACLPLLVACGPDRVEQENLLAWAQNYCEVHRDTAAAIGELVGGEIEPSELPVSERVERAERLGGGSVEVFEEAAGRLRDLGYGGMPGDAAEARAAYFEARAAAWSEALGRLAQQDEPNFDAVNEVLTAGNDAADAEWEQARRGFGDPYVAFAAEAGTRCT